MGKKIGGKIKLIPEMPREVIRKLKKNGFHLNNRVGGDHFYVRIKDGRKYLAPISVHPKELGKPYIKMVIRKSGKTNEEWVNL